MALYSCSPSDFPTQSAVKNTKPFKTQLPGPEHNIRRNLNQSPIFLGKAAYYVPFEKSLLSIRGKGGRGHFVQEAVIWPVSTTGEAVQANAIHAEILREGTMDIVQFNSLGKVSVTDQGIVSGQIGQGQGYLWQNGAILALKAVVFDKLEQNIQDSEMLDQAQLPLARTKDGGGDVISRVPLYFYDEWQVTDTQGNNATTHRGAKAHFANRRWFHLKIYPHAITFNPTERPLKLHTMPMFEAVVNWSFRMPIAVTGGIEPYEVRVSGIPPGLTIQDKELVLEGVPTEVGLFNVKIEVKDAQSGPGDWTGAIRRRLNEGTPYQTRTFKLHVNPSLEAQLYLPAYSRIGSMSQGLCTTRGGAGGLKFSAISMPPGISIDPDTGVFSGIPSTVGLYEIEINVTSMGPGLLKECSRTTRGSWLIIEAALPASIR